MATLLRLADRVLLGEADQGRIAVLAWRVSRIARTRAARAAVAARPSRAAAYVLAHGCLHQLGCRDDEFDNLARAALTSSAATACVGATRPLDVAWIRHLLLGDDELDVPALEVSPIGVGVDLVGAGAEDAVRVQPGAAARHRLRPAAAARRGRHRLALRAHRRPGAQGTARGRPRPAGPAADGAGPAAPRLVAGAVVRLAGALRHLGPLRVRARAGAASAAGGRGRGRHRPTRARHRLPQHPGRGARRRDPRLGRPPARRDTTGRTTGSPPRRSTRRTTPAPGCAPGTRSTSTSGRRSASSPPASRCTAPSTTPTSSRSSRS